MEILIESLQTLGYLAIQAGLIASLLGGLGAAWMLWQSIKRTKNSKATELDALFLASSSPGFSRFSMLNSPDTIGIGIYAALALEQVGAINDARTQVDANLKLYLNSPAAHLSAARYSALIGENRQAQDYLVVAKTLTDNQKSIDDTPQLNQSVIEQLIQSEPQPINPTTSINAIHEKLRKKPQQLILAGSVKVFLVGLVLFFSGIIMGLIVSIARSFIT